MSVKSVLNLLRYAPKQFIPVLVIVAAIAVPTAVSAWGPSRTTYTMEQPAPHVTFNSITNNPEVGDERNFMVIKDASITTAGGWQDSVPAVAGKEYIVRVYVHNDAAANLNLKSENTRLKVNVPTTTGKSVDLGAFITADNANPKEIWDDAKLTSTSNFNVAYVPGSAKLYNNHFGQNGTALNDSMVTSAGALLGYDKLDGKIPGCIEFAGYVSFKVKVQGPSAATYDFKKEVRKAGSTDKFTEDVTVNPGDKVEYRLTYKNTSSVEMKNVTIRDQLPAGMTYVAGTSKLYTGTHPSGVALPDNWLTAGGNLGTFAPGAVAYVGFTAQVSGNTQLPTCGVNKLRNVANIETDYGQKHDDANVNVSKKCDTPETPKTPEEQPKQLPSTGPGAILSGLIGTTVVGAGLNAWIHSRRNLRDIFNK